MAAHYGLISNVDVRHLAEMLFLRNVKHVPVRNSHGDELSARAAQERDAYRTIAL